LSGPSAVWILLRVCLCRRRRLLCLAERRPRRSSALSLHDALPICRLGCAAVGRRQSIGDRLAVSGADGRLPLVAPETARRSPMLDRKSTRLNSSHVKISYAVFCLKKKKAVNADSAAAAATPLHTRR